MDILLVNPPRTNEIVGNNPTIIEEERGVNPPLGLLYVAAYVEKFTNYKVSVLDCQAEKIGYRQLKTHVVNTKPQVVGLTAMTMTILDVIACITVIKKCDSSITVVLGGPHVNLFPEESINLQGVDCIVLGEGEETFAKLLHALETGTSLETITGLVFKEKGEIINTGGNPLITDLDRLPFPARHLTSIKKYGSLLASGKVVTTIFTSRGCPYKCTFCDRPHLGKVFRARSAQNVVDELEECVGLGITEFLFYDDTFCVDKKRVIAICNEIVKRQLPISWDIRTRVNTVDEEIIKHLKKANCQGIHYGIEAGTEKVLKVLNKGITITEVKTTFKLTKKYKIPILAYFMIGNPTETLDDINTTFTMMRELNPDYVHLTILTPFPGTKIYFDGLGSGIIKKDYWREFARNPISDFIPPHWGELFTKDELDNLLVKGYKSFYMRPKYILRRILHLKSIAELKKKAKAGLKVVLMR